MCLTGPIYDTELPCSRIHYGQFSSHVKRIRNKADGLRSTAYGVRFTGSGRGFRVKRKRLPSPIVLPRCTTRRSSPTSRGFPLPSRRPSPGRFRHSRLRPDSGFAPSDSSHLSQALILPTGGIESSKPRRARGDEGQVGSRRLSGNRESGLGSRAWSLGLPALRAG